MKYLKLYLFFLILFYLFSCNNKDSSDVIAKKYNKEILDYNQINNIHDTIGLYKYITFIKCLRVGNQNNAEVALFLNREFSILEYPGKHIMQKIDSLVNIAKEQIILDSIYLSKTWKKNPDYKQLPDKRVIAHCLQLYSIVKLDSVFQNIKYQ